MSPLASYDQHNLYTRIACVKSRYTRIGRVAAGREREVVGGEGFEPPTPWV
jgi:hypothetical protein